MTVTPSENAPRNWTTIIMFSVTTLVSLTLVPYYGFTQGFSGFAWFMFFFFLLYCGISITAGYHRLWSHKAYDAHPVVRFLLAFGGAAAVQNSILIWASTHRRHHRHVDDNARDPYSINRGFLFAHIGWMLRDYESGALDFSNARDLMRDPIVMHQHRFYKSWVFVAAFATPALLGYLSGDIIGMILLVGFFRLFVNHHFTFFINSLAHLWGKQPYTDTNSARDNTWLAFVTYGEGYHNFHHYFQTDYRNGVRWWQFDPTKWLISALSWVGLTRNLKRVPDFKIQEALVAMQFRRAQAQLQTKNHQTGNLDMWRETLEKEYQQFCETLAEWKRLRSIWYAQKRNAFQEKKLELQEKWESMAIKTRILEMEYHLKMQQKRLQMFNLNVQMALA